MDAFWQEKQWVRIMIWR